ncbi:MAG: glutamate ligase domain-containing protein, partial [Bacilli bacterium]
PFIKAQLPNIISKQPIIFDYLNYKNIQLKASALYQIDNAVLVLEALTILINDYNYQISMDNIVDVFNQVNWAGRFEVMSEKPLVIIDGAHNKEGVIALSKTLELYQDYEITILFSALKDKDTTKMLALLQAKAKQVYVCEFNFYRAQSLALLNPHQLYEETNDYELFIKSYLKDHNSKPNKLLVITGSLYFISDVRKYLLSLLNN